MKGLCTKYLGRREEAYDLVKLGKCFNCLVNIEYGIHSLIHSFTGIRNDIRSHTVWHVYGLLYRADHNYREASKCYLQALKLDERNQNILRDLSLLQIQTRDIFGFMESRRKMLHSRPTLRSSWIGYAAAQYFGGNYDVVVDVISKTFEAIDEKGGQYEDSELLLFQNRCYEMLCRYDDAINHLTTNLSKGSIVDKLAARIKLGDLYIKIGNYKDAQDTWMGLVREQPDNYRLHRGLQLSFLELDIVKASKLLLTMKRLDLPSSYLVLSEPQKAVLINLYTNILEPSATTKRILLHLLDGEAFNAHYEEHLKKYISDGVPPLYQDVCGLVKSVGTDSVDGEFFKIVKDTAEFSRHPLVRATIDILSRYANNLQQHSSFTTDPKVTVEAPTSLLWTFYLKSQLLLRGGHYAEALQLAECCVEHTATGLDMYLLKAKILKNMGDVKSAAVALETCRRLDLQDRYLNNKTTKYLLQCNYISQAMDTIALFTKHDGDPQQTLHDLQCNWYELELAHSYSRLKNYPLAMKKYYAIMKHFDDYVEEMFDFHSFCLKKTTLRMYADIFTMLDGVYNHKFFVAAASNVLKLIIHMIDHPEDIDGLGHLNANDRKKERARMKKKKSSADSTVAASTEVEGESNEEVGNSKDDDLQGDKLFEKIQKDLIGEGLIWCNKLINCSTKCESNLLALVTDVLIRKGKYVQAARALSSGFSSTNQIFHPTLSPMLIKLLTHKGFNASPFHSLILSEMKLLISNMEITEYAQKYASAASAATSEYANHILHYVGAAKCLLLVDRNGNKKQVTDLLSNLLVTGVRNLRGLSTRSCIDCHKYFITEIPDLIDVEEYKSQSLVVFPGIIFLDKFAPEIEGIDVIQLKQIE